MKIRWSVHAANDFLTIIEYIRNDNPTAADRVVQLIHKGISRLSKFPNSGRVGRVSSTRELVVSPLPFILVYRVTEDFVELIRVLHGAKKWP